MKALLILLPLILLAGCDKANEVAAGVIGDDIPRQSAKFQAATAARDWRAIAAEPVVPCAKEQEACGRLHAMHADACLNLAMAARTSTFLSCPSPEGEVPAWLACADRDFRAASGLLPTAERAGALAGRSNALFCRAEAMQTSAGVAVVTEAERDGSAAGSANGLLWAARSAAYQARNGAGSPDARCRSLRRARDLAARGAGMGDATMRAGYDGLRAEIADLRRTLPSCTL